MDQSPVVNDNWGVATALPEEVPEAWVDMARYTSPQEL